MHGHADGADPDGRHRHGQRDITVGNTAPTVTLNTPGQRPAVRLRRRRAVPDHGDRSRGRHDRLLAGEDDLHARPRQPRPPDHARGNGCSGTLQIPVDGEHDRAANMYGVFDAEYTDAGGLTTHAQHIAPAEEPSGRALRHAQRASACIDKSAGRGRPDRRRHPQRRLDRVRALRARAAPPSSPRGSPPAGVGGTIQVRSRVADRARCWAPSTVPVTGGWETFTDVTHRADRRARPAPTELYLVFAGGAGDAVRRGRLHLRPPVAGRPGRSRV